MNSYDHRHFQFVRNTRLPRGELSSAPDSPVRRAARWLSDCIAYLLRGCK